MRIIFKRRSCPDAGRAAVLFAMVGLSTIVGGVALGATEAPSMSGGVRERAQLLMGTIARVALESRSGGDAVMDAAFAAMRLVDERMSLYRRDSDLVRLNAHASRHPEPVAPDLCRLLEESRRLSESTNGAFDVTVLPLLRAWGAYRDLHYLGAYNASTVGFAGLELDPTRCTVRFWRDGMGVDLGGIAKGFALDRAREVLASAGVSRAVVELGGNLAFVGAGQGGGWRVAVRDPEAPDRPLGALVLGPGATVATSANYARDFAAEGWRAPSHVYDPRTGQPVRAARAVTVWGPRATAGDALSTALLVLGPEGAGEVLAGEREVGALFVEGRRILIVGRPPLAWIPEVAVPEGELEDPDHS